MRLLKRLSPKRLAGQMIALLLLALLLAQLVSVAIFSDERRFAMRAADRSQLLGRTVSVVRLLENTSPSLHGQIIETASERRLRYWLSDVSAVDRDDDHRHRDRFVGQRLAELLDERDDREVRVEFGDDDRRWWRHDDDGSDPRRGRRWQLGVLISMQLKDGRWLNLESAIRPPGNGWKLRALTWLGLMALAIAGVVIVMVRRITRPMAALAAAAERAGRGEAIDPLPEVGPIDIRQTTSAFNRMHVRLKRYVEDRTLMMAAMSHDFRTPITTLRLRAEFINDDEIRKKILETLGDMQRMTDTTLAFLREEASIEPTRSVDLTALIESVAIDFADLGHDVAFTETDKLIHACRPAGLKRALRNLIENAVRYGKRADIRLLEHADHVAIVIDDEGPGIPDDEKERMFKPFARLDDSRSDDTGGLGLGLAIARSIIRSHGGDIDLTNREDRGLSARIVLPKVAGG